MILNIKRKEKIFQVLIDDQDFKLIEGYSWNILCHKNTNYVHAYIKGSYKEYGKSKYIYLHRLIINPPKELDVDHKNGNGLDCRRENLQIMNRNGNLRKMKSYCHSGLKGAFLEKRTGKYYSQIIINGKKKHLGTFENAEQAHKEYMIEYNKQIIKENYNEDQII